MTTLPSVRTRLLALLGDPVAHSLSPRIHNAALAAEHRDAVYVALRCTAADAVALVRGIARAGGGGNVTIPHKQSVLAALDRRTDAVERTGACNTWWLEDEQVCGDNTDVVGFERAAAAVVADFRGARVLLLGAGGAAHAVAYAVLRAGAAELCILARSPTRAADLAARNGGAPRVRALTSHRDARDSEFDLLVNATPLGMLPADPLPFDLAAARVGAVFDLVYAAGDTPLVRRARQLGMPATDGREMLLQQAAASYERWWNGPAPIAIMREALAGD